MSVVGPVHDKPATKTKNVKNTKGAEEKHEQVSSQKSILYALKFLISSWVYATEG